MKRSLLFMIGVAFVGSAFAQSQKAADINATTSVNTEKLLKMKTHQPEMDNGVIVLTFEGIGDLAYINTFYDGGIDSQGNTGFPFGVQFQNGAAMGLVDVDAGGSGNTANEPSPETTMFFLYENSSYMNVPAGFNTGFSFQYAAVYPGVVSVYDGVDGTGNLLGTANLTATPTGPGDPNGIYYAVWPVISIPFAGTAKSVVFSGSANYIVFDNVTFGSIIPGGMPTPVSDWALYIGIALILMVAMFRVFRMTRP